MLQDIEKRKRTRIEELEAEVKRLKETNQKLTKLCKAYKAQASQAGQYKTKPLKQTTIALTNRSLLDERTLPGESVLDPRLDDESQSEEDSEEAAEKEQNAVK